MKRVIVALAFAIGLSGCGLMQQYQEQQNVAKFEAENAELTARCKTMYETDPRLDSLRSYVNFSGKTDSIEQLSSTKKPTAKEKQAILVWDEISSQCISDRIGLYAKYNAPAGFAQNTREFGMQQKQLRADLWAGKISYGDFLKATQRNIDTLQRAQNNLRQQLSNEQYQRQMQQAQLQAQQDQAAAQRQAAAAQTMMLFNQAQQQQRQQFNAPGTATNPVQTNCNRIGNSVNCQTYSY